MPLAMLRSASLHYRLEGESGAPVVLLSNSLGTDLQMWEAQMPELRARFQVLRYDTRGHGRSTGSEGPYTLDDLGGDVLQLLDYLELSRAHFCGISLGGITALWLAINAPSRIASIMPCNTAARIGTPTGWDDRIRQVTAHGLESIADATMARWFTEPFCRSHSKQVERTRSILCGTNANAYAWCCAALQFADLRDSLRAIAIPCLAISGTHDTVTPPADGLYLRDHIPNATFLELEAAHLSNIEAAPRFTRAMVDFLNLASQVD